MKRCPHTRCPNLTPRHARYCPEHAQAYEHRRGTTTQRGYGHAHQQARAQAAHRVNTLTATCHRCNLIILPTEAWDLGHSDDRTTWIGPEHARCNRSAGGTKGAKIRNTNT